MKLKKARYKFLYTVLAMLLVMSGCDKELTEIEEQKVLKKLSPQELELIHATNNLSLEILKAEFEQNKNKNLIFSPMSVGMALGMVYNGVGEAERGEIQAVTGLNMLVEKELNKSYNEIITFIQLNYEPSDIFCANSLWFSYDNDIDETYRTKIMAYYDAEISEISFGKKTTLQHINNWGNLKTGGHLDKLTKITPPINSNIYLINAFGVHAAWRDGKLFRSKQKFTNHLGQLLEVPSINLDQADISISRNGAYDLIDIPLREQNLVLSIASPEESYSVEHLLNAVDLGEIFSSSNHYQDLKTNISLPDISFIAENNMKNTLGNLGLNKIFQSSSDFSAAFSSTKEGITEINQVSMFEISDQSGFGNPESFSNPSLTNININKPFLYFLKDKHTKSVIFAGYYLNPASK